MTFRAKILGFSLFLDLYGESAPAPTSGQSPQLTFIQPDTGTPGTAFEIHPDHGLRIHFDLTFGTAVFRRRHRSPSQKANHLASVKESAAATSAIIDLEIGLIQMLALLEAVLAARAGEVRRLQVHDIEFNGIVTAASGEGFPFVSVQPDPTTRVALIDLDAQLIEHIHLHFALGALEFAH